MKPQNSFRQHGSMAENDSSPHNPGKMKLPAGPPPPPAPPGLPQASGASRRPGDLLTESLEAVQSAKDGGHQELTSHAKSLCRGLMSRLTLHDLRYPCLFMYHPVTPVIQHGPKCGLVACCMAAEYLFNTKIEEDDMFTIAKNMGFTRQGEMFSAEQLVLLAETVMPCRGEVLVRDDTTRDRIIRAIFSKQAVIIPYDKDKNNSPGFRNGEKAHWAIITGLVATFLQKPAFKKILQKEPNSTNLFYTHGDVTLPVAGDLIRAMEGVCHVYGTHGKSIRMQLWDLDTLLQSNGQLQDIDPKIKDSVGDYVIPEGGIASGLRDKIVILDRS